MSLYEIISWIGIGSTILGSICLALMHQRHASRFGGYYRCLSYKPIPSDIKLLEVGIISLVVGLILFFIGVAIK